MGKNRTDWITRLSAEERIAIADERLSKIIDNLIEQVHLHESNRIICFSELLRDQIPNSRAAIAFNLFTETMIKGEISQLCRVWDPKAEDRNSLPTVEALVNDADVKQILHGRIRESWQAGRDLSAGNHDPGLSELLEKADKDSALGRADLAISELERAISKTKSMQVGEILRAARDLRNMHLSHSLTEDARKEPAVRAKFGDERKLLDQTIHIVDAFNLGIRNSSYDWDGTREIAQRNARALWERCTFEVLE